MTAEWVLTEESHGLLCEAYGTSMALYVFPARLAAIERAAIARVLTVENVARALRNVGDGVCPSSCPDEAHHREDAAALIAALTEDVP